ncbi:MAG TPA: TetR-like C-terminal domain-containing protein [Streptosporangiaceae bacterium]|nr:TetR-like C-terminal domain-containing protein [Streptosporangiaceae bacterium]
MPRAGLNRERIAQQAATVADQTGLDQLTLAAVAARCGVSLPGLYKHIDGVDAVKRDIAVLAVRELTAELAQATAGLAGRDALIALSRAYRSYARAHPGRYAASVRAPDRGDDEHAAAGAAAVGLVATVLKGYRIEGTDMIDAVRILRAALHGFVSMEAAGGFGLPQSVDATFTRMIDALHTAWTTWDTAGQTSLERLTPPGSDIPTQPGQPRVPRNGIVQMFDSSAGRSAGGWGDPPGSRAPGHASPSV